MYGFQFRIFMRSRHSGGPRRVRQQGGEGRPERILCYASIEKWADQESVGGPEGAGPAVYMSNLHFQYFLLGRKHQLSSQSAALRARRGMVLPGFKTAKKGCSTFSEFSISVGEPPLLF